MRKVSPTALIRCGFTADRIREEKDLSWEDWAGRVQDYLQVVERLLSPDLIILGGGVSKKADRFLPLLHLRAPIVPATLRNQAGIVGAAVLAAEENEQPAPAHR